MADIRSSGDDALPAPQQSQSPKDELTNMPSEDFNPRSTSLDNKQPVTNDSASSENKSNEEEAVPAAQPAAQPAPPQAPPTPSPAEVAMQKQVKDVLISDIGIATLLNRLKQSIASAKEFAAFLKKRAVLEDDQAQNLKKLCRVTQDNMRRADHRQGSFAKSHDEIMYIHERMAENGIQFAASLHQMHEDIVDLSGNAERGRKMWKSNGLSAEQKVADLDQTMRKSKNKYDSLAEEYDRARTGEGKQGGKVLGAFKAHKSAAQQEEDLLKKVQAADQTYHNHVQTLQAEKSQLESSTRPEAVKAIQDLINEVDSALTLQMQKFAAFNEKLLLGNGMIVYPFKNQSGENLPQPRSLRQAVASVNNERDLNEFISSHHPKVQLNLGEVKYEKHPVLSQGRPPSQPMAAPGPGPAPTGPSSSFQSPPQGGMGSPGQQHQQTMGARTSSGNFGGPMGAGPGSGGPGSPQGPMGGSPMISPPMNQGDQQLPYAQQHNRSFSQGNMLNQPNNGPSQQYPPRNSAQAAPQHGNGPYGAPQLGALPFQGQAPNQRSSPQQPGQPFMPPGDPRGGGPAKHPGGPPPGQAPPGYGSPPGGGPMTNMPPPSKPVFGISLSRLYERDGFAVPTLVLKCLQTVMHFGLEVEGIYRVPGNKPIVEKLKSMADADVDNPQLEFLDPAQFFYEIHNVTGLLKQFFRDLPDPLLTSEHYSSFIAAAHHKDPIVRRDSIHAIINSLPDPNYATLRALALHLHKVIENERANRMDSHNLAVVLGPTLLGAEAIGDLGLQTQVVDTILQNTYQIFDDD